MRAAAILVFVVAFGACSPKRSDAPAPPVDPTRMSHERHAQMACQVCHREGQRPGQNAHQPCDDGACHRKEFLAPPTPFCQVCHEKVTANPLTAPLKPYPAEDAWQAHPPRFSHQLHLDSGRVERRVGFHVTCQDCHARDGTTLSPPDHGTCARCHATEVGLANAPQMPMCVACHLPGVQQRRQRTLIKGDLRPFDHEHHRTDRRGAAIACAECHVQTSAATDSRSHPSPRIESCVTCHDDAARAPDEARMRQCQTCHLERASTLAAIAPRNHLPLTEKPLDHTLAFRRDHAESAGRNAARCATCHTQMSGNAVQACDECHQTMKPANHRITWRELDHGPDAIADRERCATCHVVEFCTACHAQRPRSHGFNFVTNHATSARINIRPCLTCHGERVIDGRTDCEDCHAGLQAPARGTRRTW